MKRLLKAFSALAIINLLGILGAVGWLAATKRLTGERVEAIKQVLQEPAPVEAARLAADQAAAEAAKEAEDEPLPDAPPVDSGELVAMQREAAMADEFRMQRLSREEATLGITLQREVRKLEDDRQKFETERRQFETKQAQIAALKGDEQFQAALSVLTQVKPDKAMSMLQEIIDGRAGTLGVADTGGMSGKDRAVAYLDELDEMVRGKIMSEFVDESPTLAADLLERLRTFGLMADASGGTGP